MQAFPLALMAFVFYLAAASWQALTLLRRVPPRNLLVRGLGGLAVALHLIVSIGLLMADGSLLPGFSTSAVLITGLAGLLLLVLSMFKPVLNIAAALFPFSGLVLLLGTEMPTPASTNGMTPGIALHAASSALAFAVLAIAALQAVLVGIQNKALKHHRIRGVVQALPPLTTMERVLFEMIWVGMGLLTLAIGSGIIFLDDMFAQHLVHKTVLSLLAWLVFATLLICHHRLGWRGMRAVHWTLGGYIVLLLAYFGSKFVLEVLLTAN
ncbi:cytochrome C assembly family protein [Halomonas binhaiensis]|uniref:Cytochrome c biogenesis protein CcsA n=1 Tax=Halomonas binhaiensis TaxID=2562282 RepID=A0A5C1NKM6_9GAMM|nr:cytochrome c biogenesis protein CcsA [Halomonas binhaiensis]QEM83330.1 cytochrome c biogenesis protein CcsA [Halomonas binhaiensis]